MLHALKAKDDFLFLNISDWFNYNIFFFILFKRIKNKLFVKRTKNKL